VFGGVVYCLSLVLVWAASRALWGGPDHATAQQLDDTHVQIEDTRAALSLLQPRLSDSQTTLAASRTIGDQPDFSILMSLLASLLDEETVLSEVEVYPYDPTGASMPGARRTVSLTDAESVTVYELRINGYGRSQSAVSEYVLRLERCGLFRKVHLLDTHKQPFLRDDAVAFRVECALGDPATAGAQIGENSITASGDTSGARGR
jgi:hypothetical protein